MTGPDITDIISGGADVEVASDTPADVETLFKRTNAETPGGVSGGVIESVKRGVMVALKEGLLSSTMDGASPSDVAVEMEYPMIPENYPGVWVQFSFKQFSRAGIGMEFIHADRDPTTGAVINWTPIREFQFTGTVTLTLVALSNLERDRLSDSVVAMLMFARPPNLVITDPAKDTQQFRGLLTALANNPYVSMTVNTDTITPGGQSVVPGVPWDEELPGYEDNYSFEVLGQTNIVYRNDGTYTLRAIAVEPFDPPSPFEWQ
jgi:hypothetical protein